MKNNIKILCLSLAFLIVIALSSELASSVFNINDNDCKTFCLLREKSSGTHEFCYNTLVSIRCNCGTYSFSHAVECDTTCQGYSKESKYCPSNNCEYMCTWKKTSCTEHETSFGTRTSFEYFPSSWDECEKRASEDMKCEDKDNLPEFRYDASQWQSSLFLLRFSGLKDAYWQKCSVPVSMGDCGTGDTSTACDENGCTASTAASAKLIVPENALSKQQDIIEDGQTIVNLGVIISIYKDYALYDYTPLKNSKIIDIYNFYPNSLSFNKPSALIIDYLDDIIENENGLDIYYYADGFWTPLNALHNKKNKTLTAYINKLGIYALIELEDTAPPGITLNANPSVLWPPNNKLTDVTISGSITDDISGVDKASITLMVDNAKKEVSLDNNGNFRIVVPLLASRIGTEIEGKKYYINLTSSDNAGNTANASYAILVPHDMR